MAITAALRAVYASAPTDQRHIITLAFSHSLFPRTYYLVRDNVPWNFLLETGAAVTFTPAPFNIILPTNDGKGNQDLNLTLANFGRDLVDPIEAASADPTEAIKCVYRVYLDIESSLPANDPVLTLTITALQETRDAVTATATRADILGRAFPYNFYKYSDFPGLRR